MEQNQAEVVQPLLDCFTPIIKYITSQVIKELGDSITKQIQEAVSNISVDDINGFSDGVEDAINNNIDISSMVSDAVDEIDLEDKIKDTVRDMSFEVTVS